MKKRILAFLLGGVVAAGSLALQMPVEVQAATVKFDSCDESNSHVKSSQVANVEGKLSVTIDIVFETEKGQFGLFVFDKELIKRGEFIYLDMEDPSRVAKLEDLKDSGTYTFDGLAEGKTYYVYCRAEDNHECNGWGESEDPDITYWHDAALLGSASFGSASSDSSSSDSNSSNSSTPDSTPSSSASSCGSKESAWATYEGKVTGEIKAAQSGSTVVMEKGVSTLSNSIMKELAAKGDVSLKLEFTYEDEEYVIVIPAGKAVNDDIPWYGPLYLAAQYGNSAKAAAAPSTPAPAPAEANRTYEVKSGDNMNKIAAANNMTLTELLTKNSQIKNPNKIAVGQKINL